MWYVMQVYTGQEMEIARQCRERVTREGEEVFVPRAERMRRARGEAELVKTVLFPGYVFIETEDPEGTYLRLKSIKAMTKLLKTGEEITPLYPEEEVYLRRIGDEGHVAGYSEGYLKGDKLVVTSGALKGSEGLIKKVLRHKRLAVLEVPLLGRKVEVTLGLGVVEKR